jgi:hypothetical protein
VLATPVAERLVLGPPAALVELGVRVLHDVKRIGHHRGVGERGLEDRPEGSRQIEGGPLDVVTPHLTAVLDPALGLCTASARDDIEELGSPRVDDRGGIGKAAVREELGEGHLVQPQGADVTHPLGVGLEERLAIGQHRVIDRAVTAEVGGDLGDGSGVRAHLVGRPASRPRRHGRAHRCDPLVLLRPGLHRAVGIPTLEAPLHPHRRGRPTEAGPRATPGHGPWCARSTRRPGTPRPHASSRWS